MKIGFIGTHGTGKTVATLELVCELKKQGYSADVVTEAARSCPFPVNERTTPKSQMWIFAEMLKREQECKADIVVCDRTLIDVIAYTKKVSDFYAGMMRRFVESYVVTYDAIFYMGPNPDYLKDDNFRSVNLQFQQEIKELIDDEIQSLGVPIIRGDSKKRLTTVMYMAEVKHVPKTK
jgi:predicted ATPase